METKNLRWFFIFYFVVGSGEWAHGGDRECGNVDLRTTSEGYFVDMMVNKCSLYSCLPNIHLFPFFFFFHEKYIKI